MRSPLAAISMATMAMLSGAAMPAQQPIIGVDAPASDELNKELPKWLKFGGEFRTRLEGLEDRCLLAGRF